MRKSEASMAPLCSRDGHSRPAACFASRQASMLRLAERSSILQNFDARRCSRCCTPSHPTRNTVSGETLSFWPHPSGSVRRTTIRPRRVGLKRKTRTCRRFQPGSRVTQEAHHNFVRSVVRSGDGQRAKFKVQDAHFLHGAARSGNAILNGYGKYRRFCTGQR